MTTNFKLIKNLFYIVFGTTLTLSIWTSMLVPESPWISLIPTLIIMFFFMGISLYVSEYVLPKALKKNNIKSFVIIAFIFIIILDILLALGSTLFPHYPNDIDYFSAQHIIMFKEKFATQLYKNIPSAMAIITTTCGLRAFQEHHRIEQVNAKLKQEHLEAHLKLLQDQINPHLMFNVLNHIHILMQSNVELASTVLLKFSDILRYQLYECNHKLVLLHREIQYLQDLVDIEKVRWGDELDVECNWELSNKKLQITPLLLVPLIENAFKHVSRLPNTKGYILINCIEKDNTLTLYIENSYSTRFKIEKAQGGIGIENVRKRLDMQYADSHIFDITHTDEKHIVELSIKLSE
ncbi:sensor histidine kinase [Myroides sp.]|uniref:sensor histidine kinase n=1 Tax=Myroides sp. TaxID=1874736 RepID=UPI003F3E38F5